jgi:predicted permease
MLWIDVRYALRLMRRSPGFTAVAVLSLALGIGANTAIFSLINTIMLRTLPVSHPEQLVQFLQKYPGEPRGFWPWSRVNFEHFRDHNHSFAGLTCASTNNLARVSTPDAEPETLVAELVNGDYFSLLGLKAAMGRLLGPDDVPASGDGTVAVVSWSYWATRLHRDPNVLGKRLVVSDAPVTIVGVAPRGYSGPRLGVRSDVWMPGRNGGAFMFGRLKPGVKLEQARAEAAVLYRFSIEEMASTRKDPQVRQMRLDLEPAGAGFVRVRDLYAKPLLLLMAVVALLLLLACINMASMLLARGAGRQREMAVRVGLGASRGRLMRQVLTESVLLSAAGTLAGVVLAYVATAVLVRILGSGREFERINIEVVPDLRLFLFTAGIAVLTGLLFGLAPAWYAFRSAPASPLRQTGRAGETPFWRLFGKSLVSVQVALSILLLAAAAAFLGHVSRLRNLDLGFHSDHVLLVQLDTSHSGYQRAQLAQPYQQLLTRLEAMPGVRSASIAACTPIQGCGASRFVTAEGYVERPQERRYTSLSMVAPKYFETLGISLRAGRDFTLADANRPRVAIISEGMARHYFPNANPIGKRVRIENWNGDAPYEIVGVVGDAKYIELREPAPRTMYLDMYQEGRIVNQLVLRTSVDPAALTNDVRRAVHDILKTVQIAKTTTLSDQVDAAIVPERLIATLSGYFGALGGVLAGIGLYGLLAYTVARRVNEIGVRMALGATSAHVIRLVVRDALAMVCIGVALGAPLVLWARPVAARLIEDLRLPGAAPIAAASAGIVVIAVVASYLPARRAVRVDPMEALRHE